MLPSMLLHIITLISDYLTETMELIMYEIRINFEERYLVINHIK